MRTIFATFPNMTKLSILPTECLYVFHIILIKHIISLNCLDGLSSILETDSVLSHIFINNFQQTLSSKAAPLLRWHDAGHSPRRPFKPGASPCRLCGKHSGTGSGVSAVSVIPPMLHINFTFRFCPSLRRAKPEVPTKAMLFQKSWRIKKENCFIVVVFNGWATRSMSVRRARMFSTCAVTRTKGLLYRHNGRT